jgi:hypothetical protein
VSKFKCNNCGATYSDAQADGTEYYHACAGGDNPRNENPTPGLQFVDGEYKVHVPDPETPGRLLLKKAGALIVSEGAGRTLVE